ncbi:MAG TPA: NAD-dependent epimerase/dehydratase family protein [Spirochaetota bacterium]|nr:NAD-dependent epimerase/dehydratase family protein [Spirochaetota bacterium]
MKKRFNVFITGVSGFIGQKIIERFSERDDVGKIIGIDVVAPPRLRERITFIEHDVRDDMAPLMSGYKIDWAIHAAFVVSILHDKKLMEDVDINGTVNFLNACAKNKIKHVMHMSSTTAYGAHEDNPPLLGEDAPLRGNEGFIYGMSKAKLELTAVREFFERHPDVCGSIVRPCFVCGPHFYKNTLGRHLMKRIVMLPGDMRPFQFVHEDDVADSMYHLLAKRQRGAFNLAADGTMTFREMLDLTGGTPLPIHPALLYPLNDLAWMLRLSFVTEFPSAPMALIRFPWIASNDKIKNAGYRFKYTTREAFETFAELVLNFKGRGNSVVFK